jgi:polyisoprenoid-binding protein YceI
LAVALSFIMASTAVADSARRDAVNAPAGVYELDPRHSSLSARVLRMGISHYTMRFTGL